MAHPRFRALARRLRSALTLADPLRLADARSQSHAGELAAEADAARADGDPGAAARLYAAALRLRPDHFGLQVQAGHMFKEAGDMRRAETHYLAAQALQPDDADLALQLGHFYKIAGRRGDAEREYRRAQALSPSSADPAIELARLATDAATPEPQDAADSAAGLVPELFPRGGAAQRRTVVDALQVRRLGARRERTPWGVLRTLRGVEAVRGFCISSLPLSELTITLGETVVHRGPLEGHVFEGATEGQRKWVFNIWLDLGTLTPGPYRAEVAVTDSAGELRTHVEYVAVMEPLREADFPGCDGIVDAPTSTPGGLAAAIDARPSVVRPARRALFPEGVHSVLVMRTDQLGDMVTSTPAVRRLRELLPHARLVALVTDGNADFTRTLGLFDEVLVADFPDDRGERKRVMDATGQAALRARLAPYRFDIAIDLAESAVSRPLMLLTGARFLYGYFDREWPFLDAGFDGATHDRKNDLECAPQSTKVRALIDRLGNTLQSHAEVIRRPDLDPARLARFGLEPGERFALFHTGARIVFSRWPHFGELARLLLERTGLKVVILTDDPAFASSLPSSVLESGRFRLVDERLPFDDFDALLSFCAVFVGNDTGPKHLAALRGTQVVSLHSARINWSEWGQELTGSVISRKVPCAGCTIYHDEDECGIGFPCITRITPEEVFAAVLAELGPPTATR